MGTLHSFTCSACSYSAEVSGGGDAGMMVCTSTIVCEDCKELYDITTCDVASFMSPTGKNMDGSDPKEYPFECPESGTHKIKEWKCGDPCPKCGGGEMVDGGVTILWD